MKVAGAQADLEPSGEEDFLKNLPRKVLVYRKRSPYRKPTQVGE